MKCCEICGKGLKRSKRFCSRACVHKSFIGDKNPMYKGAKLKSICKICSTAFEYYKGSSSGIYCSIKCSDGCQDRISKMKKTKTKTFEGEPDRVIKARIRSSGEYLTWSYAVYAKSKRRCVQCGSKKHLQAHHIIPFSVLYQEAKMNEFKNMEWFFDLDNGEALCKDCHEKTEGHFNNNGTGEMQLLRVLKRLFNRDSEGYKTFPSYYENKLETLINHFKTKLDSPYPRVVEGL